MIRSDDMRDDAYAWVTNQCGHGVLGIAVVVVADALGLHWLGQPIAAALVYWLVAEVALQRLRLWRDAIMDTAHVMAGASLAAAIARDDLTAVAVLAVWGALLGFGAWRRR
ncbi:MAG: hypothetical protein ACLFRZ_09460 [Rhodosalinus sp.]